MFNDPVREGSLNIQHSTFNIFLLLLLAACHSTPPPAMPAPAAAPQPVEVVAPPPTLEEVRALKTEGKLPEYESGLQMLTASADVPTRRKAEALLAQKYLDEKRDADALPLLQRAADEYPEVAAFLRLRTLDAARVTGNTNDAIAAATRIIQETPASSAATVARLRLPALYAQSGDAVSMQAAFDATKSINIDELTEPDFVDLAKQLAAANRNDLANAIRMRLLLDYPQGRFTEQTYDFVTHALAPPTNQLTLDQSLALAAKLAAHDRYDQALDFLRRTAGRFPEAQTSAQMRSVRMRALFNSRHYPELLNETANVKLDAPLALMRARASWRAGKPQDFLRALDQIERDFRGTPEAAEAKSLRAKYYASDEPNLILAARNYAQAIDAGAIGTEGENLWNLGFTYVVAKENDAALETFALYQQRYPDGDYLSNSLFWSGKVLDRLGRRTERDAKWQELLTKYPYSYFSFRARELMGMPPLAPNDVANGNVFPNVDALVAATPDPRLATVRELMDLGMYRDASREMQSIAAAYPDNLGIQFLVAETYVRGGEPFRANGVLQRKFRQFVRHGGSNIPHRFWEILFPLNYWETIRTEAEKRQIDPYLIASIIRQETGFEPSTVSNAGAVGIMQIMPAEAARIAAAAGLPPPTREQLFDPNINIAVGAAEFAQKLAAMRGNPILAIAAYNGGEDAVGRWIAQVPVDDIDLFVESIPFFETKLYVKTVSRNRFEYRRIYEALNTH